MASKYLNSKWTAPSLPLTSSWLYLLTMKVYDTPEWLDGIFLESKHPCDLGCCSCALEC